MVHAGGRARAAAARDQLATWASDRADPGGRNGRAAAARARAGAAGEALRARPCRRGKGQRHAPSKGCRHGQRREYLLIHHIF